MSNSLLLIIAPSLREFGNPRNAKSQYNSWIYSICIVRVVWEVVRCSKVCFGCDGYTLSALTWFTWSRVVWGWGRGKRLSPSRTLLTWYAADYYPYVSPRRSSHQTFYKPSSLQETLYYLPFLTQSVRIIRVLSGRCYQDQRCAMDFAEKCWWRYCGSCGLVDRRVCHCQRERYRSCDRIDLLPFHRRETVTPA